MDYCSIRKHIVPEEALTGGGEGVSVDEALYNWVIITALEVIELRFCIVIVATKADLLGNLV